jgi:hypothetical protein
MLCPVLSGAGTFENSEEKALEDANKDYRMGEAHVLVSSRRSSVAVVDRRRPRMHVRTLFFCLNLFYIPQQGYLRA